MIDYNYLAMIDKHHALREEHAQLLEQSRTVTGLIELYELRIASSEIAKKSIELYLQIMTALDSREN